MLKALAILMSKADPLTIEKALSEIQREHFQAVSTLSLSLNEALEERAFFKKQYDQASSAHIKGKRQLRDVSQKIERSKKRKDVIALPDCRADKEVEEDVFQTVVAFPIPETKGPVKTVGDLYDEHYAEQSKLPNLFKNLDK